MEGSIRNLYHYPIKGLSGQELVKAELKRGQGFPFDRIFGFARHDSGFDINDPRPIPKDRFLVLLTEERLAGLQTSFEPSSRQLKIEVQNNTVLQADLSTEQGIADAVSFFSTMFDLYDEKRPIFAHSGSHRFTDVSVLSTELMNSVSLINLESVREFEQRIGRKVDPVRFRANIYFDGWAPFSELEHVGKEFLIGEVRMKVVRRTKRCAATEVDPSTARRNIPIPRLLMKTYGHPDLGIYAEVCGDGIIRPGDVVSIS